MRAQRRPIADALRHGAYVCLRGPGRADAAARAGAQVPALAARLGLANEFEAQRRATRRRRSPSCAGPAPRPATRGRRRAPPRGRRRPRRGARPRRRSPSSARSSRGSLGPAASPRVLGGVVRPMSYTGNAMNNFAYAHRVLQQPGAVMPNAFLVPMSKTPAWWAKDWMERHTYFLPRYDDDGPDGERGPRARLGRGHPVPAAPHLQARDRSRRPRTRYDFVTYFECARRRRPDLPRGLRGPARRPAEPGVGVRPRGADVAWTARGDVGGAGSEPVRDARRRASEPPAAEADGKTHRGM